MNLDQEVRVPPFDLPVFQVLSPQEEYVLDHLSPEARDDILHDLRSGKEAILPTFKNGSYHAVPVLKGGKVRALVVFGIAGYDLEKGVWSGFVGCQLKKGRVYIRARQGNIEIKRPVHNTAIEKARVNLLNEEIIALRLDAYKVFGPWGGV